MNGLSLELRAKRSGTDKDGRVYSITVSCRDASGNVATRVTAVRVLHDRRK